MSVPFCIKNTRLPQYRFEWHEDSKKVYLIRNAGNHDAGEIIALDIQSQGEAMTAVQIWSRGYHEGRAPDTPKLHLVS